MYFTQSSELQEARGEESESMLNSPDKGHMATMPSWWEVKPQKGQEMALSGVG